MNIGLSKDKIQIMMVTLLLPYDYSLDKITPGCSLHMMLQDGIVSRVTPYKLYTIEDYNGDFDKMQADASERFDKFVRDGEAFTVFTRMDKEKFCIYTEMIMSRHKLMEKPECLRASQPDIDIFAGDKLVGTYHTVTEAREAIRRQNGNAVMKFPSLFDKKA